MMLNQIICKINNKMNIKNKIIIRKIKIKILIMLVKKLKKREKEIKKRKIEIDIIIINFKIIKIFY